ncbi:polysaccharide biosynthesis/export family protein [Terriglobus roseus]|uniref:Protein involved in polysaccharide export, contains SLBB domain of the beta-grasp fold n=1 Tax=Terriglobus roseus TaxID=392734 RepID=A0A1H4IZ97_9BACT|nr:polysaccharide biosynthesis/export family protein [Terriglobus roseus]SEB39370.1 protein involved in polysaccharide export, contains SLBB domain of the beta-grasp fold [Terriglobus roseus]
MAKLPSSRRKLACATAVVAAVSFSFPLQSQNMQNGMVNAGIIESSSPGTKNSSVGRSGMTVSPEDFEKLKLAPGYLLQMEIYDTPEMSREMRIDAQGNVTVPLLGSIHLADKTLAEAESMLSKELVQQKILIGPQVTLNVIEFTGKNISVLGEVRSPGRVQLLGPKPLADVLALAAGETDVAGNDIEIQHPAEEGGTTTRHVDYVRGKESNVLQTTVIEPGDTVIVHKSGIVYVLGAVNRPGGYLMVDGGSLNVTQAVSLAGGTTLQAGTRWATVVRPKGDSYTQIRVPLNKMQKGNAEQVLLQRNDVLYVPLSGWKVAVSNGSSVLSAATSASIYRAP